MTVPLLAAKSAWGRSLPWATRAAAAAAATTARAVTAAASATGAASSLVRGVAPVSAFRTPASRTVSAAPGVAAAAAPGPPPPLPGATPSSAAPSASPSPPAVPPPPTPDFVREAVQRLLGKEGADDALLRRAIRSFQTRLEDAQLCVRDCLEAAPSDLPAELEAADAALERAAAAYVDVLDGLREQAEASAAAEARRAESSPAEAPAPWEEYRNAVPLKALRADLDRIRKQAASAAAAAAV